MSKSRIVIIVIWTVFIADALRQGIEMPSSNIVDFFPADLAPPLTLAIPFLLFTFFLCAAFFQRKKRLNLGSLTGFFDKRFGPAATQSFLTRLRPFSLLTVFFLVLGSSGMISTYSSKPAPMAFVISSFFLSSGLGLLCALLLSLKFPPRLN